MPVRPIAKNTREALFVDAVPQATSELTSAKNSSHAPAVPQYSLPNASQSEFALAVLWPMMSMCAPTFHE